MRRLVVIALLGLVGCGGGVRATGTVGDRALQLDGTGAAWLDETLYLFNDGAFELVDLSPVDVTLHLLFSGAVFNPRESFDALGPLARAEVESQIARSDRLELIVRRGDRLAVGDVLEFDTDEGGIPQASPFVDRVLLNFGAEVAGPDADYPDALHVVGGRRVGTLEITELEPSIAGRLRLEIGATAAEEGSALLEGDVDIGFDIEPTPERIAECNFARGDQGLVDPCLVSEPGPLP